MSLMDISAGVVHPDHDDDIDIELTSGGTYIAEFTMMQTAPPLRHSAADVAGKIIARQELTRSVRAGIGRAAFMIVYLDDVEQEDGAEPGSPNAAVLLSAIKDLTAWMNLNQQQTATYLGISPQTVMAWRRERPKRPRHPQIPTLLRLWAAVSGAIEELGSTETLQLIWGSGSQTVRGVPNLAPDDLAEVLIDRADQASIARFDVDDGYTPATAEPVPAEDIEAGELDLSRALTEHIEGPDEPDTA